MPGTKPASSISRAMARRLEGKRRLGFHSPQHCSHPMSRTMLPSLSFSGEPLMAACDLALVASGTASLELAYFQKPMVVVYPLSRWQERCFRVFSTTPFISTVNLLAGRELVPERFVANTGDRAAVAGLLERFLTDTAARARCRSAREPKASNGRLSARVLCEAAGK